MILFFKNFITRLKLMNSVFRGRPKDTLLLADTLVDEKVKEENKRVYPFCSITQNNNSLEEKYFRNKQDAESSMHKNLAESKCSWMFERRV